MCFLIKDDAECDYQFLKLLKKQINAALKLNMVY